MIRRFRPGGPSRYSSAPAAGGEEFGDGSAGAADVYAYTRTTAGTDSFLIVLNFGEGAHALDLRTVTPQAEIVVATDMRRCGRVNLTALTLDPHEGLVLRQLPFGA